MLGGRGAHEGGESRGDGTSRAQRGQTAGNAAPDGGPGAGQGSASRLERGQRKERILIPEALEGPRESPAGLFPGCSCLDSRSGPESQPPRDTPEP